MTDRSGEGWERLWHELMAQAPQMSEQGREYLDLAKRLVRANRVLMQLPELEEEAFQEVQSISMLLHSVGEPEEYYVYQLIDLITHLLDRLYVHLEYLKWEISPLSRLPFALLEIEQLENLTSSDLELLAFLRAFNKAVRTGAGLAEPRQRDQVCERMLQIDASARHGADRRLRALVWQVSRLLDYYEDQSPSDEEG